MLNQLSHLGAHHLFLFNLWLLLNVAYSTALGQGLANIFCEIFLKNKIVNTLAFVSHVVSLQLWEPATIVQKQP